MRMSSFIGNLISGPLNDNLEKAQKAAPAAVDKALASAGLTLTTSVEKVAGLFTRLYTQATTGIAAWLPSTKPWILAKTAQLIAFVKVWAGKL